MSTHVEGMKEFFISFVGIINILVVMFIGGASWKLYDMTQILTAIDDIREQRFLPTPSHNLVSAWVGISLNKKL